MLERLVAQLTRRELKLPIGLTMPLAQITEAHQRAEAGGSGRERRAR